MLNMAAYASIAAFGYNSIAIAKRVKHAIALHGALLICFVSSVLLWI